MFRCPVKGQNISIVANQDELMNNVISLVISLCDKNVNPLCHDTDTIINNLNLATLEISIENNNIDHFNYSHPIKANYLAYFNSLNPFASVTRSIYYQVKTYESDNGYLFEDKKIEHPIGVDASISSESQVNREPSDYSQPLVNLLFCIYSYYADKYSIIKKYKVLSQALEEFFQSLKQLEEFFFIFSLMVPTLQILLKMYMKIKVIKLIQFLLIIGKWN